MPGRDVDQCFCASSSMGRRKKLAPLREIFAKAKSSEGYAGLGKRAPAEGPAVASARDNNQAASEKSKKRKSAAVDDDEIDWEKVEAEQNAADSSDSSSNEDEDSDGDDDGIRLDGSMEHEVEDYTFEFNDMREDYAEGICTMLRKFIANPTEAYALATTITSQSKAFLLSDKHYF